MTKRFLLFIFAFTLAGSTVFSTTIVYRTLNDLARDARTVIVGQVTAATPYRTEDGGLIRTRITIAVSGILKGSAPATLTITQDGGTIGETTLHVHRMPQFKAGERVILFLGDKLDDMCPVEAWDQGRFSIVQDPKSGSDVVVTEEGRKITGLTAIGDVITEPEAAPANGRIRILGGCETTVSGGMRLPMATPIANANDFINAVAERTGMSPLEVRVPPPPMGKKGSGGQTPEYVIQYHWASASCTIMISPGQYPNGSQQYARIKEAAFAWNGLAGSRFTYVENTNRVEKTAPLQDGTNFVTRASLSSGTLGVTYYWTGPGNTMTEMDLIMTTAVTWTYTNPTSCSVGSPYDFWNVAVHEFGHGWGLGHESSLPATLNPYYPGGWGGTWIHDVMVDDRQAIRLNSSSSTPVPNDFFTTRWKLSGPGSGVVTNVSNLPSTAAVGSTIAVEYGLHTQGMSLPCKPLRLAFYLSSDTTIAPSDYLMGVVYVAPVDTFTTNVLTTNVTVPGVPPGTYNVGWRIDDLNLYTETNKLNNATVRCASISITAGTAPVRTLSAAPAPLAFGSQQLNTTSAEKIVTITNAAGNTKPISGYAYLDCNATEFAISSGDGAFTLNPGETRSVAITFTPSQCGARTGTLHIDHDAASPASPLNVALTGSGACADINWLETDLSFGKTDSGLAVTKDFIFENSSSSVQNISGNVSISASAGGQFTIASGGGSFLLAPGQQRIVTVQYKPNACGAAAGTLSVTHNALNDVSPKTFPASGSGACRSIAVTPPILDFGSIEVGSQSQPKSFFLSNPASSNDTLTVFVPCPVPGTTDFTIAQQACGAHSLAPGAYLEIPVTYKPSAEGPIDIPLQIDHNAINPVYPQPYPVELRGSGRITVYAPIATITTSFDLGAVKVGRDTTRRLTLTNNGNIPLRVKDILLEGAQFADFQVAPTDSFAVAPGQSVQFTLTFHPSDAGIRATELHFTTNDPSKLQVTVILSGTGLAPKIALDAQQITFGQVTLGSFSTQSCTATNEGNEPLTLSAISVQGAQAGDYSLSPAPPFLIQPGQSKSVMFTFTPGAVGARIATAAFLSNGGPPDTLGLSGEGTARPVARISASASQIDFGSVMINTTANRSVDVTNQGTADLTISNAVITNFAPADYGFTFQPPVTLGPRQKTTIPVSFHPTSLGLLTANLSIQSDDPQTPNLQIALRGTSTSAPAPRIALGSTLLDFGTVILPGSVKKPVLIQNQGSADLELTGFQCKGSNAADFKFVFVRPFIIHAGAQDSVPIEFAPVSDGQKSAWIEIAHNDTSQGVLRVDLRGAAASPAFLYTQLQRIDFGTLDAKDPAKSKSVVVQNSGGLPLAITKQELSGPDAVDFSILRPIGATLAAGAVDSAVIALTPNASRLGSKSGIFHIETDAAATPSVNITLTGAVTSQTPVISAPPLSFALEQNYPNPFGSSSRGLSATSTIRFSVPERSYVEVTVMNALGVQVAKPAAAVYDRGIWSVILRAKNLPTGVYFYRITAQKFAATRKMTVLN